MARTERGIRAARRATACICDPHGAHKGQGLLIHLGKGEGSVVLTCHHVVALVRRKDLRVKLPAPDGVLGEPVDVIYDEERSRPEKDAAVLRISEAVGQPTLAMPLLHRLGADTYEGALGGTVLTHLTPETFDATVRPSTRIDASSDPSTDWPDVPERYRLRVFRLANSTDSRPGFSGGVVISEGGVLGLAHFGRKEDEYRAREAYLVPLSVWAEGWPALEDLIEPLVDEKLKGAATVKRVAALSVGIGADVVVANYRPEVYAEREADELARRALDERGGVLLVGKPLAGKTRLALELLLASPRDVVIIPKPHSPAPPEGFEPSGFWGLNTVVLLDDLHRTAQISQTLAWRQAFEEATGRPCKVVCTARDGEDWRQVEEGQRRLLEELGKEATVFVSKVGGAGRQRGKNFSAARGRELAEELGMSAAEFRRRFDGTPGSLLLNLEDMRMRYERLRDEERGGVSMSRLLDSAKLLYRARQPILPQPLVRATAERVRGAGPLDEETWEALIRRTREEGFAELDEENGVIRYYAPYLERCVLYEPSVEDLNRLQPLMEEASNLVGLFYLVAAYGHDLNEHERALAVAEQMIELNRRFAPSWYNMSYALNHLGRSEEALEASGHALSLDPEYHPAYYAKAWALSCLDRHVEALEAFGDALKLGRGSHPGAISMYLDGLSSALAHLGRFYEAVSAGLRALSLYPPYPPSVARLCNLLCAAGEPAYALEAAESALTTDAEWPEAWYGKGLALDELGRWDEALNAYDEAINLRRDLPQTWSRKGLVLLKMSQSVEASDKLAKALTKEGLDAVTRTLAQRAVDALDTAIDLGHDYVENRMNRAIASSRLDRSDEALEAFEGALELKPRNPIIHHNKGLFHARERQYDEALEAFSEATRLRPRFASSWWPIVVLLSGQFNRQEYALFAVDHLIRLRPMDAKAWFAKGCILAKLGRSEEAEFWVRCARSQEDRYQLTESLDGKRYSAFDFMVPESPEPDERYAALGSRAKGPFSSAQNPMQTMCERFERLRPEQQDMLRALQLLAFANVLSFSHRRLRAVLQDERLFGRKGLRLHENLAVLAEQAFVDQPADQDPVLPEFACLLHAVSYGAGRHPSEDFDELANVLEHQLADYEGLLKLGRICGTQLGDFAKALAHTERALNLKRDCPEAWTNKSFALGKLGRPAEALKAAQEAEALMPGHPAPLYNKGTALNQLGRHAEALTVFDEVMESWPDNPRVLLGRGEALAGLGRAEAGAEELVRAGNLHPDDPDLAMREGMMLLDSGDHEGALRAVNRALSAHPQEPLALFSKGIVLMAADRQEEAREWFLRAWSMRDSLPDGGAMVARMLRELGHDPGGT